MSANQQVINGNKLLAEIRKRCGVDAPLSSDSSSHSCFTARGKLATANRAPTPQEATPPTRTPQEAHYQQWRDLKGRADKMMRTNPAILRGRGRIPADWRQLCIDIDALEAAHADELQQWRQWSIDELHESMPKPDIRKIRLFGRMMARAQLLRHELSFRLWAVVRYIADGENNVLVETIRSEFSDGGKHAFTSWPNLRKQINQAIDRGYFHYSKDKTRLYFASERRVAVEVLGLDAVGGWALGFTIDELTNPFVRNRAIFQAAFHGSRGDGFSKPISRQSIKRETGRGKRTQRKYEQLAEVKTEANYELIRDETSKDPKLRRIIADDGSKLVKDLPNSYAANLPTVKRGRRWLNQRITHLCKSFSDDGHKPPVLVMGSCNHAIKQRRYFTNPPNVVPGSERFYPLAGDTRLWSRVC